jgi:exopolyphosphatase / guanosine-5'-triphosphate,3'-diphosphate pyrophosphatase
VRVGVVDIGSNSTRLLVADADAARGKVAELQRESVVTRLGEGVDAGGRLRDDAQERVLAVLERYAEAIAAHGCERTTALMTSAVRDAANGHAFAAAVRERGGLEGRTLRGDEEAELTFAGATVARPEGERAALLVIDIGGGSTELVLGDGFHVSTQVGVVRHGERHVRSDPPRPEELERLGADARATIEAAVPAAERAGVRAAVAVAGTATSCGAIDLALEPYEASRVEGHVLPRARLVELRDRLAALPLAERRRVPGLHPDRAPTIVPGIVILLEVLATFGLDTVQVSDRDLLWGAALRLAAS